MLQMGIKSIIVQCLIYSRCVNGCRCGNYQPAAWQLSISWPAGHAAGRKLRGSCLAGNGVDFNCCWEHCLLCFQCSERELNRPLFFFCYIRDAFLVASAGTAKQLPDSCEATGRQLPGERWLFPPSFPTAAPTAPAHANAATGAHLPGPKK